MDISMRNVLLSVNLHCTSDIFFEAEVSVSQGYQHAQGITCDKSALYF